MFSTLFPDYVAISCGTLLTNKTLLKNHPIPVQLQKATISRQLEFLSGRSHAKQALKILGHSSTEKEILINENRAPIWPSGIIGSISHTQVYAGAVVANTSDVLGIGFDIEHVFSESLKDQIQTLISSNNEWNSVRSVGTIDDCLKLTLIYVAKEAIYKCLAPITNAFFDFQNVRITEIDMKSTCFKAELCKNLHPTLQVNTRLEGRFFIDHNAVYSGLILPLAPSCLDSVPLAQ